mgnify:CR=1 FL=1
MTPTAPDQSARTSFGLIIALWAAGLCAAAQFAKVAVIFPELLALYADAGSSAGFLLSLLSFLGMVLGLVAGILVATIGYRRLLLAALVLGSVVSAFQASLPSFGLMLASRLVEGGSHLVIVVAAPTLIAQLSSNQHRAAAMTLWGTFFGVAFALVAWLGLPLVNSHGPASLFAAHSAAMALMAVILYVMLPADKPQSASPGDSPLSPGAILLRHARTYASPFIAAPALGWLFYTLSFVSLLTILPETVATDQRSFVIGAMPLATTAASMVLGVILLRHLKAITVVMIGFAAAFLCAILLWRMPGAPAVCLALFAALGLVQGASFSAVPELNAAGNDRAYANGALAQMGNLGNLSGTPILLWSMSALGFNGLILFALLCFAGGLLVHGWLAFRRAQVQR